MVSLADLIARVESGNNAGALRFEPAVYARLIKEGPVINPTLLDIMRINAVDPQTARMIYATSWGKFQIMGETLYSDPLSYEAPLWVFFSSEVIQGAIFNRFVAARGIDIDPANQNDYLRFATVYNGPGDPEAYAEEMIRAYRDLGTIKGEK
jgi:hypothetical protein